MGLNFYLYFFTSALFRTALKNVFRCGNVASQAARVPNVRARLAGQQDRGNMESQEARVPNVRARLAGQQDRGNMESQ